MAKTATDQPLDPGVTPWLVATAAATLAPHFLHTSPWQVAFIALLGLWRLFLWHRRRPLPPRWLLTLITVAGTAGVAFEHRRLFGQDPGVALLQLFMALKLLESARPRDARVLVTLGYFLLLTHYFYQDGIPTGAWMVVALTVLSATLIRVETAALAAPAMLRKAAFMIAQSLPVAALLFLLFPRVDGPLWGLPQEDRRAVTGLSEEMSPGSISDLTQSAEIAFRATFDGPAPAFDRLYWRGPVMTDFDGRTWRTLRDPTGPRSPAVEASGETLRYTLTLEPHQQRWLIALDMPVAAPGELALSATATLMRRRAVQERFRYEAESAPGYRIGIDESPAALAAARALPRGANPRTQQLAQRWRNESGSDEAMIARVLAHFRNEDFAYTLQPPLLGEQPVDDFLFRTRRGFCEHYASAFAVLMRAAGIPARVVGGYQGGSLNPVDGYWVIRQADAHAWVEVWLAGRGWLRVDPTAAIAPSRVEQGIAAAAPQGEALPAMLRGGVDWLRQARLRWEAVNNAWNQWVLGYDQARQFDLLGRLGLSTRWQSLIGTLVVATAAALLLLALWALRQDRQQAPELRLWANFCARMAGAGTAREPWEGPAGYARRLALRHPETAALTDRFCSAFARYRYRHEETAELVTMSEALSRLERR
jgi:transglutaminase-like putative cysteine protease